MARYWISGGNGNWSSTTNWSSSSGGSAGASVPTSSDNVFFDANSNKFTISQNSGSTVTNFLYGTVEIGQRLDSTFTANISQINYVECYVSNRVGSPVQLIVSIYDETTSTVLGSKTLLNASITVPAMNRFTFDTPISITPGHVIQIRIGTGNTGNGSNYYGCYDRNGGSVLANSFYIQSDNAWSTKTDYPNDDLRFNLNYSTSYTVTLDTFANCNNMDWTGVTCNPTFTATSGFYANIYGNLTLVSGMNVSGTYGGWFIFLGSGTKTITTAGKTCYKLDFQDFSTWTLQDALNFGNGGFVQSAGTINTNNQTINGTNFTISGSNPKTLNLGSSVVTITGAYAFTSTNTSFNAGTSTLKSSGSGLTFAGNGLTYNRVELQNNTTISDSNTFSELVLTPAKTYTFTAGTTQTISRLGALGAAGNPITLQSSSGGNPFTLTKSSGNYNVNYCSIQDCSVTTVTMNAYNSTNVSGNNANVIFQAGNPVSGRFWINNGGNWSDSNHWSSISGGIGQASIPSSTDNVYFDSNSFNTSSQTVTVDVVTNCLDMNWIGVTNTPTFANTAGNNQNIYGNLTLVSGMNVFGTYGGYFTFLATTTGKTITTAGKTCYLLSFNGSGDWTLQDNVTTSNNFTILAGTLNTNNKNISCSTFSSTGSSARILNLGSSVITASSNVTFASTGITLNVGTSKFVTTGNGISFDGGGLTFFDADLQNNTTIQSSNTFINKLKFFDSKTYTITAGTTQTVTFLEAIASTTNGIVIQSSSAGNSATISKVAGQIGIKNCSIKDIIATGGATFDAVKCTNVSGNSGWNFVDSVSIGQLGQSTPTTIGLVSLATSDETLAGLDASQAVTPYSLRAGLYGSGSSLPTPSISIRGKLFLLLGGAGVADIFYICRKKADESYEWYAI